MQVDAWTVLSIFSRPFSSSWSTTGCRYRDEPKVKEKEERGAFIGTHILWFPGSEAESSNPSQSNKEGDLKRKKDMACNLVGS